MHNSIRVKSTRTNTPDSLFKFKISLLSFEIELTTLLNYKLNSSQRRNATSWLPVGRSVCWFTTYVSNFKLQISSASTQSRAKQFHLTKIMHVLSSPLVCMYTVHCIIISCNRAEHLENLPDIHFMEAGSGHSNDMAFYIRMLDPLTCESMWAGKGGPEIYIFAKNLHICISEWSDVICSC